MFSCSCFSRPSVESEAVHAEHAQKRSNRKTAQSAGRKIKQSITDTAVAGLRALSPTYADARNKRIKSPTTIRPATPPLQLKQPANVVARADIPVTYPHHVSSFQHTDATMREAERRAAAIGKSIGVELSIASLLGSGGYGTTYLCIGSDNRKYALKIPHQNKLQQKIFQKKWDTHKEGLGLGLDHPHIINTYAVLLHDCVAERQCVVTTRNMYDLVTSSPHRNIIIKGILMEFAEGRELQDILRPKSISSYKLALTLAEEIADGLEYLHHNQLIYRDLKPENIIMTSQGVKLVDLGMMKDLSSLERTSTPCGTRLFSPPEIFYGDDYSFHRDSWSLGMMMIFLLGGDDSMPDLFSRADMYMPQQHPDEKKAAILRFARLSPEDKLEWINWHTRTGQKHQEYKQLILKLLNYREEERLSVAEARSELQWLQKQEGAHSVTV